MMNVHIMIETRLIHGQVGIQWAKHTHAHTLLVANDETKKDEIAQKVMKMAIPSECEVIFTSVKECQRVEDHTLIVVKSPLDALTLYQQGIIFDELLVRNMEPCKDTHQVAERVHVSSKDVEAFVALKDCGVKCIIQRFPEAVIEDNTGLFK